MAIRFQCPTCSAFRAVNQRLLGQEIKCPECGNPVRLPTKDEIEQGKRTQEAARRKSKQASDIQRASAPSILVQATIAEPELSHQERVDAEERALAAATTIFTRPKLPTNEDMDMTPMVDVTFLLLIFFMITASFSVQKSIQRPAQRNDDPSLQPIQQEIDENPDIVTVQVDEFNAYSVITTSWDRVVGSKQDLIVALIEAHSGNQSGVQPTRLIVQAHEDCIHAAVIAALDAGREAQFENFEVSTVEQFF